jgi:hypothetical protein
MMVGFPQTRAGDRLRLHGKFKPRAQPHPLLKKPGILGHDCVPE